MPSLTYRGVADQLTDRIVAGIQRVEGVVTSSTSAVAGLVARVPAPRKQALAEKADVRGTLASARKIAETNFGVAERLLGAQKQYALSVLGARSRAAAPTTPRPAGPQSSRPAAAKTKPAPKSTRPRKAAATNADA